MLTARQIVGQGAQGEVFVGVVEGISESVGTEELCGLLRQQAGGGVSTVARIYEVPLGLSKQNSSIHKFVYVFRCVLHKSTLLYSTNTCIYRHGSIEYNSIVRKSNYK